MPNSSTPRVAQLISLGDACDAELASRLNVLPLFAEPDSEARLRAMAPADVALIVTSVRQGLAAETIAALPNLQAICSWGVGYETLALDTARAHNIAISNTPDVLSDCVADHAWGLLLAAARHIPQADRYVRDGQWQALGTFPLTTRVWGKRLGILGLGRIGAAIARRGQGFDMAVRYHNRRARPDLPDYHYEPSLLALADWADFLVIACPGGPDTRHQVDEPILRALGPRGVVVNIARGSVIDEQAMTALLQTGALGGAGLDVLEVEPSTPNALRALDSVVLTPHVGSATHETRQEMAQLVVANAISFMETGRLMTPIYTDNQNGTAHA